MKRAAIVALLTALPPCAVPAQEQEPPAKPPAPAKGGSKAKPGPATPPKSEPPAPGGGSSKPLPPVLEPARSAVERRDLLQEFRRRNPIEGTYRLKHMVRGGNRVVRGGRGYLMVGQRHLSLHLYAPGNSPTEANIQAVFRKYKTVGEELVMSTLLGHRNKDNGDIALEPISYPTKLRFVLTGAVLRLYSKRDEYLEFERIE